MGKKKALSPQETYIARKKQEEKERGALLPPGLINHGNTCFMNSVLQGVRGYALSPVEYNSRTELCLLVTSNTDAVATRSRESHTQSRQRHGSSIATANELTRNRSSGRQAGVRRRDGIRRCVCRGHAKGLERAERATTAVDEPQVRPSTSVSSSIAFSSLTALLPQSYLVGDWQKIRSVPRLCSARCPRVSPTTTGCDEDGRA